MRKFPELWLHNVGHTWCGLPVAGAAPAGLVVDLAAQFGHAGPGDTPGRSPVLGGMPDTLRSSTTIAPKVLVNRAYYEALAHLQRLPGIGPFSAQLILIR
jgi:DNA uptake protein ComE-like DNA-binding protein